MTVLAAGSRQIVVTTARARAASATAMMDTGGWTAAGQRHIRSRQGLTLCRHGVWRQWTGRV